MADDDANARELKRKVGKLVREKFGGNYRKAFQHYAGLKKKDGKVDAKELYQLLEDADVGNWATRGKWVSGVMEKLDKDKDGSISLQEFEAVMKAGKAAN